MVNERLMTGSHHQNKIPDHKVVHSELTTLSPHAIRKDKPRGSIGRGPLTGSSLFDDERFLTWLLLLR